MLFEKKGIPGVTIEQVERVLVQSNRYASTAPVLFSRQEDGSFSTYFLTALWDGLRATADKWMPTGSQIPLATLTGTAAFGNLSEDQKTGAAQCIQSTLEAHGGPKISLQHIRDGWLAGRVIAPRDKDGVALALWDFAPLIREIGEKKFSEAYGLYVTVRQTVMRSISMILGGHAARGQEEAQGKHGGSGERLSIKPEIALIAAYFANDISTALASTPVLEIKELEPKNAEAAERDETILKRGIAAGEINDPKIKIKPVARMGKEFLALTTLCNIILVDHIVNYQNSMQERRSARNLIEKHSDQVEVWLKQVRMGLDFEQEEFFHNRAAEIAKKAGITDPDLFYKPMPQIEPWAEDFIRSLYTGQIDTRFNAPHGKALELFTSTNRLLSYFYEDLICAAVLEDAIKLKKAQGMKQGQAISTKAEEMQLRKVNERLNKAALGIVSMHSWGELKQITIELGFGVFTSRPEPSGN
ncbi:hypothetical protein J4441_00230 [Candidatus Micrarchaeota archaeon]|nr:hypothetical protein [Candidatus Micrarchaeota archaeon]